MNMTCSNCDHRGLCWFGMSLDVAARRFKSRMDQYEDDQEKAKRGDRTSGGKIRKPRGFLWCKCWQQDKPLGYTIENSPEMA